MKREDMKDKNLELMKLEKYQSVMEKEMDALRVENQSLEQYLNILHLFMEKSWDFGQDEYFNISLL